MEAGFRKNPLALAMLAAIGTTALAIAPTVATAADKAPGQYVSGDFHNHTTCSDGSISMQKLVKKATDKTDTPWGLDWFVQAGHGGNGNRNCTLAEDASLATPAYPLVYASDGVTIQGPTTTWQNTNPAITPKGLSSGTSPNKNMWRWQSIQEFQYPLIEYLATEKSLPLFIGVESVVAGHEHTSMSVITDQMPSSLDSAVLPNSAGYTPQGNANALAQWEYCFDRGDTDTSQGNTAVGSGIGNNWNCSIPGSANSTDASLGWSATAQKLIQPSGTGTGTKGHLKTVEGVKWMAAYHPNGSYYVPAHLERAGPFNPDGNNGFNVEHLRNFNNAGPKIAFGFETQPGHGASSDRGEYKPKRQTIGGVLVDSVGGTTWGGTGVYGAQVGGVWDALLGEGRNWWFFASSDWHNRGTFGPDDRRSTQDFFPGEYQRTNTMVRNGSDKLRPQTIVDGLRSGNSWSASGQIIDRLGFIACASYPGPAARTNASVEALALTAATNNTDIDKAGCATMGEKLVVRPGAEIVVSIVARDPSGTNYSPYTFNNPSLAQVGINQALNMPVLDHIDVISGKVTGYKTPGAADYSGQWPNTWLVNPDLATVPAAAKNTSAAIIKTFNNTGWTNAGNDLLKMTYRIPAVTASQYVRLRGTNLPAAVPFETDANGNPLADVYTNAGDTSRLSIPCTATSGTTEFDKCPSHLATASGSSPIAGAKAVSYDVAAWSDLWFYSNPIYVQVNGSTIVAGVK
ncbi:Histidinol phosphatase and related hydrolases of the PHP family [Methylomonas albis]|uniref:DUF3604 domain-containing protein n=1 Tax=Methylomonas albis TaxID=1854563 RepID=A0ABR9D3V7_9GAMM|nr:hypothetical protein [Methylomonas albis]MBD9357471.1 hypothetical protein [Methylomonas albis]CAD6880742.1 Histidinol phosphatase and related hydrolases of the PHP family [Methylomonas albis]